MSFIPRTLLVRTFLLLSVVILATLGIWTTLFGLAEREPRARHLAELTASAVNVTHAALLAAAPEKRRFLLLELSEREGIHLTPAGHERVAQAALVGLGLAPDTPDWDDPLTPLPPLPLPQRLAQDGRWARDHLSPWVGRHLRGRSSGDGRPPKRPTLTPLP